MKSIFAGTGRKLTLLTVSLGLLLAVFLPGIISVATVHAANPAAPAAPSVVVNPQPKTGSQCGSGSKAVKTSIDFGCYGDACQPDCSPLVDATFAIIRFLSAGVGIVIVGSTVFAGIQYMSARDDPSAVGKAKSRITSNFLALLLFIFGYAILNYVIPAGFFI